MKTVNKIVLLVFAALFTMACSSTAKENTSSETTVVKASVEGQNTNEAGAVVHLTTEEFKQKVFNYEVNKEWKYEGTVPCIVDFYADWCGPCNRIAPVLDELAKEYDGKVIIYKVNTDKERNLSAAFGISSIPTILFVPVEGQPQAAKGALPKETFVKAINEVLLKPNSEI